MAASDQDPQPRATENDCMSTKTDLSQISWITSRWRWPSDPEMLPEYIHLQFRVKAFSMLAIRSAIMFGIMSLVHVAVLHTSILTSEDLQVMFFFMGLLTLSSMLLLHAMERDYPLNYTLLLLSTLLAGIWWGLVDGNLGTVLVPWGAGTVHFGLIGCVSGTGCAAAAFAAVLPCAGLHHCRCVVATPLLLGWLLGATAQVLVAVHLGAFFISALTAALLALLFMTAVLFNAGDLLKECDPDALMRVVLAMDVTLFVMAAVSLPLLGPVACCLNIATRGRGSDTPQGIRDV